MLELAILTVFPAPVVFAAAMDFFTMTIPNQVLSLSRYRRSIRAVAPR